MKSDARLRYTKMVIKNSFVELLAKKRLTKVTVKEICELSGIVSGQAGRSFFRKSEYAC